MCTTSQSNQSFANFQVTGVNEIIDYVGEVFIDKRYTGFDRSTFFTHIDLDNPDDNWLVDFLRTKAAAMQPLNVTPTGLKSLTDDSLPPVNTSDWFCTSSADAPFDFRHDSIDSITRGSVDLALTTLQINRLDGISDTPVHSSGVDSGSPKSPKLTSSHSKNLISTDKPWI